MEVKWKWEARPNGAIVIGKMAHDAYFVTVVNYPPKQGYSDRHFFIAEINVLNVKMIYRLHHTRCEVKETYSEFFDIKDLNFGLCYDEQD